jgi:cytochrome c oxidase subunit II
MASMATTMKKLLPAAGAAASTLATMPARAEWGALNMPEGVTRLSKEIYDLHMLILWICVAIGVVVFGAMIYSLVKYRKSRGAVADTSILHSDKVEFVWTIIPVFILVAMAVPAAKTLLEFEDMSGSELTVKVTGYQWQWRYDYLDAGVGFYSRLAETSNEARQLKSGIEPTSVENYLLEVDNPLVVPEDTKVRLLLTANDVIHAWWVPALAVKRDAIPGFINELWFQANEPGTYRGQCAELCGRDHGFMPVVVIVKTKEDYAAWLKAEQAKSRQAAAPAAGAQPLATGTVATLAQAE